LLGNLLKKPMTVRFPQESIPIAEGYRGEQQYDIDKCISCGLCQDICPKDAIKLTKNVFLSTFDSSTLIKQPTVGKP
jgi:ech hydrogenase subunit F